MAEAAVVLAVLTLCLTGIAVFDAHVRRQHVAEQQLTDCSWRFALNGCRVAPACEGAVNTELKGYRDLVGTLDPASYLARFTSLIGLTDREVSRRLHPRKKVAASYEHSSELRTGYGPFSVKLAGARAVRCNTSPLNLAAQNDGALGRPRSMYDGIMGWQ